jgi:DNA (cytosine-5)-methyltransferase 1|tara:strand:+ start:115 stop:993 length:879 start_codon:yes stop_codon:yes gene_type:complete
MSYTFIDLFAGIGGFHLALHKVGMQCVFASEIDETARQSYINNFEKITPGLFENNLFNKDIFTLDTNDIPNFNIICGGFPCQPFSQIGKKKGFNESLEGRGNLFYEILRIIKDKRPDGFFLENVRHLLNHDSGNTFETIKQSLEKENYSFNYKVIKASDFNLPQLRPRIFLVGFDKSKYGDKEFKFPDPIPLKTSMSDVFNAKCSREVGFTLRVGGRGSAISDRRNWDGYIVNGKEVRLSPLEGLRMQGFPDDFILSDSKVKSMKLLGNSVAVNVIENIGENIKSYLGDGIK